jgi:hypothetical protein
MDGTTGRDKSHADAQSPANEFYSVPSQKYK